MKQNKTISLNVEIAEELEKQKNGSKLINDLLTDYFKTGGKLHKQELINKISIKEIEEKKIKMELNQLKERLGEINLKETQLKETYKKIPQEALDDFRCFPNMTKEILIQRYKEIYGKKYEVTYKEIYEAYCNYFDVKEEQSK